MTERIATAGMLAPYMQGDTLLDQVRALLLQQNDSWMLVRTGYQALESIKTKTFLFDTFVVKIQHNSGRLASTSANIDPKAISERPCFLCLQNLPPEQKGIPYKESYLILVNPFPIFNEHFTVVCTEHRAQRIAGVFGTLLDLAGDFGTRYVVLYNGPRAGASAPDHHHFQLGDRSFVPLDFDYAAAKGRWGRVLCASPSLKAFAVNGYLRPFVSLESNHREHLVSAFDRIYQRWLFWSKADDEPMMNILVFLDPAGWRVILIPRSKHRSSHYFREEGRKILVSPGAVDLGGTCMVPRREDFDQITRDDIAEIFGEVCLGQKEFREFTGLVGEAIAGL
jgi:ATP adenylyltransferase/5',5'''-P-1,P-4-tetraphosphate phosphorylase II